YGVLGRPAIDEADYRRWLLRARCERPRRRAAKCGQQFPPSDGDCHTPLPCEVRKGKDTTSRACSLAVQGGQESWLLRPQSSASTALPPPALGERRHRGLVRRLELWCTAAPGRQYLASLRSGLWDLLANDYAATYLDAPFIDAIS